MITQTDCKELKDYKENRYQDSEKQSEILATGIIKTIGIENTKSIHTELDKFQIRGSLSITTELQKDDKITTHVEFIGYDYKVQCWVNFAYFI